MRILHIAKYYPPERGGIETHVKTLADYQSATCEVVVLACNTRAKTDIEESNPKVIRAGRLAQFRSAPICPALPMLARRFKSFDIIHVHEPNPIGGLAYLSSLPKKRLVVGFHMDIVRQRFLYNLYRPLQRALFRRADALIASAPVMLQSSKILKEFRDRCHVIPYGINLEKTRLGREKEQSIGDLRREFGRPTVLFVGRLVHYKGLEYLIRAIGKTPARLVVVGSGPMESKLKGMAAQSEARDRIEFVGQVSEEKLLLYYHAVDIFVLPSCNRGESFGLVQLEAMACSKPVISTDLATGTSFVNVNNTTGLTVPPRDPESLAKAVNALIANPELRRQYGQNAKQRAFGEFSHQIMGDRIQKLYDSVLAKN